MRTLFPLLLLLILPGCLFAQSKSAAAKAKMPEGPGKETTFRLCNTCHSVEVSISRRESREGWNAVVVNMVERGAKGSDDEFGEVVDYLTDHFPVGAPGGKLNPNTATAEDMAKLFEITPEQAEGVVKYRTANGKFKSADDVAKVPGMDLAKVITKKLLITFE